MEPRRAAAAAKASTSTTSGAAAPRLCSPARTMGERKQRGTSAATTGAPRLRRQHHSVDNVHRARDPCCSSGGEGKRSSDAGAYLRGDAATGKPNRFGWKSWSQQKLSELSSKRGFGRFKDTPSECLRLCLWVWAVLSVVFRPPGPRPGAVACTALQTGRRPGVSCRHCLTAR